MFKRKSLKLIPILLILSLLMVACGQESESSETNPMEYISVDQLMDSIKDGSDEYVMLDVRKVEDYNKGHIKGSYEADVDAANKGGDDEAGIVSLKKGLLQATESETGNPDDKYVLICYSGKSYAQKATDLLIEMGLSKDQIITLEGGMSAWEEGGQEYTDLIE
ncbi:MAG: rhodanese-like domain-containing protein [Tissierella sp.]|uniref:rhodanese-like domain-containing protein n=1 Tax=Tissierella sp. TaxID=41274 RepID=UPI003F9DF29F